MGVLNVTPDSFSDGGAYSDSTAAVERALQMIEQGADIIDIGGESTRPGAEPVGDAVEIERVLPVIQTLRRHTDVFISVDTVKPEVMRSACAAGADMINDVTALRSDGAVTAAAESGAAVCLMHMQGEPRTMQNAPYYDDVVAEVGGFLRARLQVCEAAGIERAQVCLDPGFGFGKTLAHNLTLMRALPRLHIDGASLLVGVSRKSMFARLFERDDLRSRINGSLAAAFWAATQGAGIIRTHDVRDTCQMLTLARSLTTNDDATGQESV